jgi:signal transduction histidine kinase/CheY-like chemotaxis protein/HAMP domain-containing protein
MLELKNTINGMVNQLNGFVSEVTRVAREVGTEGKLGQAAAVTIEVGGVWKDLTDNVNLMAGNLTGQVRNIAEVTTAVANGDLSKKISIDVQGEFLELKNTVNAMVDQLNAFAGEVSRVAREVGVEGRLGGQAQSTEVSGVWKDLTDDVNQLAANLTDQVRAIADVATAVTDGDLTRQVRVEARGEVGALSDTVNEMIRNLRETTRQNVEQDWLKTNRESFTRMLQGQRDLSAVSDMILSELAPLVSAQHGAFYAMTTPLDGSEPVLELSAGYGYEERKRLSTTFAMGDGLVGQCAKEKKRILLTEVPPNYVRISSGLGAADPLNIIVLPVLFEGVVRAVIELASFSAFSVTHLAFLDQLTDSIGLVLNTIEGDTRTADLLRQSQSLAAELRSQQEELRASNEDLGRQARQLEAQKVEAEQKKQEVEESKQLVEEKAGQLAVSSKYKSEFIANMSHELRTPLNSLLILAEQLEINDGDTMTGTQVEYASVIRSSGKELLDLLNGILDLAKVESGTVSIELAAVSLTELRDSLWREFELVAQGKGLAYSVELEPGTPEYIHSDPQRLRQVLKNLLANAFKFTERGEVTLRIGACTDGWTPGTPSLDDGAAAVAFTVTDTGIGIDPEQQLRIFDAFAQADGSTARLYGGTGLGLSISRDLVGLLGGEIAVTSTSGRGSAFTVFLPAKVSAAAVPMLKLVPSPPLRPSDAWTDRPFAGTRVLIVDDDYRNVFAMNALLERGHAEVVIAESGDDALTVLRGGDPFDVVLMDILMPGMDGYAAIRAIRELDGFQDLPIIAVTGEAQPGERERCLAAGANEYVTKPVDAAELRVVLGAYLRTPSPALQPGTSALALGAGTVRFAREASVQSTDGSLAGVKILLVDDDYRNIFALTAMLDRDDAQVASAESGPEALAFLETEEVDLVLMDIMMPAMDGYDTMRAIRKVDALKHLPIIAVTGKVVPGERDRCLSAGANDYIPKPVNSAELRLAIAPYVPLQASP